MRKKNPIHNKKGVTIVELIVTFALISIFVVLTGQIVASAIKVYTEIQSVEYGKQVSDTIMNKIAGELSGAQVTGVQYDSLGGTDSCTMKIQDSGKAIEFRDENGSLVRIYSGRPMTYRYNESMDREDAMPYEADNPANWDNQLIVHYFVIKSGAGGETVYEPVDWTFDKKAYQGYHIEKLKFSRPDYNEYPWNIIKVELKLASEAYGLYETTRYIECYNFKDDTDKIIEEGNPTPATPTPVPLPTETPSPEPSESTATPEPSETPKPSETPSPEPTYPADEGLLTCVITPASDWHNVTRHFNLELKNISDIRVIPWSVEVIFDDDIESIDTFNNYNYDINGNKVTFTSKYDWNAAVEINGSINFAFQATGKNKPPAVVSIKTYPE